jgi:hypothetical protein
MAGMVRQEWLNNGTLWDHFFNKEADFLPGWFLMIIVLGLIGLVLFQGISKPVSSLSALEPILPHAVGEILEDQSVLLNLPVEG